MAVIEAIATTYLEAAAASVTFSSLGSYEHLQIRVSGRDNYAGSGGNTIYIRFNGDTGSNYSTHSMQAYNGSNVAADAYTGQAYVYAGGRITGPLTPSSANYGTSVIDILDYRNANKNTTMQQMSGVVDDYEGNSYVWFSSSLWDNTAAVTSILLYPPSDDFERGTEMTLYGLNSS
jgi:hypothetical protein